MGAVPTVAAVPTFTPGFFTAPPAAGGAADPFAAAAAGQSRGPAQRHGTVA